MPLEEDHVLEQEPVIEHLNTEDNSNSGDGVSPNSNPSDLPNSEPPPMTNDLGENVWINTNTIRVGEDYYRPKSKKEVKELVADKKIKEQQANSFLVQYEAVNGQLPEDKEEEGDITTKDNPLVDLKTVLPELTTQQTEQPVEQDPINLESIAGNDWGKTTVDGNGGNSTLSTSSGTGGEDIKEAPLINLEDIRKEGTTPSSETTPTPVKTPLPSPEKDPAFKAVTQKIEVEGDKEQKHNSSSVEVKAAEDAAVEPSHKKQSIAQANQVAKIEEQETPAFDTANFVTALMNRVKAIMPKTEEDADKFKDSGKINEVKQAVTSNVTQAQDQSVGPVEQTTKEQPNESGIPTKEVKPLTAAPIGRNPIDIHAETAMPKPVGEELVEEPLKQNAQQIETQLSENKLTEDQLAKSNEPTFLTALDAKKTAQKDSQESAVRLRTGENQTLSSAKNQVHGLGKEQMGAMHQDRATILTNVQEQKGTTSTSYSAEEAKVATKIGDIYQQTKSKVEGILSRLDTRVQQLFEQGAAKAQQRFESYVDKRMAAYKAERYEGVSGKLSWIGDAFTGLPDEVNAFFVEGRNLYIEAMRRVIEEIATHVAQELNAAKQQVETGRQEVDDCVNSLPDELKKVGQDAAREINSEFDALSSQVDAKQGELVDSLAQKYKESVETVDNKIQAMKAANRGLVDIAMDAVVGVVETVMEVKAALTNILSAAMDAVGAILMDPIGFLSNLINGVSQGVTNFMTKIQDYMTTGFVEWLTGAMTSAGIEMPEDVFSLEGIFSITTQALGLTWNFIRERAVNILGEGPVKAIEEGFEVFQVLKTDGVAGAWEYLKEEFSDLKETILGSITEMLISEVVQSGIQYILSLLTPAGAFVKAAMMIVDIAQFFIRQGGQLMELVAAFTQSVSALAAGAVGKVAELIERALAISIPLLIGFFASLLNLGDMAAKVQKIFRKITGRITGAIDGFIEKAGAWFKDKKGRRKAKKDKKKKEREEEANAKKKKKGEKDERSDQQKKGDFKKGMEKGEKSIKDPQNTEEEIKTQISQNKRQYQFDQLDAKLVKEKGEVEVWVLSGKLDKSAKVETIERPKSTGDIEIPFKMNGINHTLYFRDGKLFMASKFGEFIAKLDETIKTLDQAGVEVVGIDVLLSKAKTLIKNGKGKGRNKLKTQTSVLENAEDLIQELQNLNVSYAGIDIGVLSDLSKEAVNEVAEKHQRALDQKVINFVNSTTFESDNNALGKALVIDSAGELKWVRSGGSTNHVLISRAAAIKIRDNHDAKGNNYQGRGPASKRNGSSQINLEVKPDGAEWSDYRDPHFSRDGYCNYHINVKI